MGAEIADCKFLVGTGLSAESSDVASLFVELQLLRLCDRVRLDVLPGVPLPDRELFFFFNNRDVDV